MSDYTFTTTDKEIQAHTIELFEEYKKKTPDINTINALCEEGIDIHARNNNGYIPLHRAARYGNSKIITFLLEHGADIHARDNDGCTPLRWADGFNETEATTFLLAQGANIWAESNGGAILSGVDGTELLIPHRDKWQRILSDVLNKNCDIIKTTQDLYHLASVMKPENPKDIPEPKEFIRELFARYLPHTEHLNKLYSTIFNKPRGHKTLAGVRDSARQEQRGVV